MSSWTISRQPAAEHLPTGCPVPRPFTGCASSTCAAPFGLSSPSRNLLAIGLLTTFTPAAHADTAGSCTVNTAAAPDCTLDVYVPDPQTIDLQVSATTAGTSVNISWESQCGYDGTGIGYVTGVSTPADESDVLHKTIAASDCMIAAAVWFAAGAAPSVVTLTVTYTPHDPGTAKVLPVGGDHFSASIPAGSCDPATDSDSCTVSAAIDMPASVNVGMTGPELTASWQADCGGTTSSGSGTAYTSSGGGGPDIDITLGMTDPPSCTVHVTNQAAPSTSSILLSYVPQAAASPSPAPTPTPTSSPPPVHLVRGFDGMCVRDLGDSAARRTPVVAWACDPTAQGQSWTYAGEELKIHGDMCMNAKGKAASGSKVLLWPCSGAPNEIWLHRPGGEYVLNANRYRMCLTDPGYSTTNGAKLTVTACTDATDQRWSLP